MGICCTKLDSIEHANTIIDLNYILKQDRDMFHEQMLIVKNDTVFNEEQKSKKLVYFNKIIEKFEEYHDYLDKLDFNFNDVDIINLKWKYKKMTKELNTLQYSSIDNIFMDFEELLYKGFIINSSNNIKMRKSDNNTNYTFKDIENKLNTTHEDKNPNKNEN